jgi:hypothetical protein
MSKKFPVALALYAILAVLAWFTLDASVSIGGREVPLRAITLLLLGLFAFRTWIHQQHESQAAKHDSH